MDRIKERGLATITNLAYIWAGVYAWSIGVPEVGAWAIVLGLLSGTHHWVLEKWSRLLDYIGMYGVGTALVLWLLGVPTDINLIVTPVIVAIVVYLLRVNRIAVGVLFGLILGLFTWSSGPFLGMAALAMSALAFGFNQLGDKELFKDYHGIFHGQLWHIITAFIIMFLIK